MENRSDYIRNKVKKFILDNELIEKNDKVLIALSGGSDSVCLFHILNKLKEELDFELFAFHLNHHIRQEAVNDEIFVKEICSLYNVKLFSEYVDIPSLKEDTDLGIEELSRIKRYELIDNIMKENGIDKTATAHHLLDHCESIILNLVRGSGIKGLRGIGVRYKNVIRPMLTLTKSEIMDYIKCNNLRYVTDITNFNTDYSRNNIRHNILPHLEEINTKAYSHFYDISLVAKEVDDLLCSLSSKVEIFKSEDDIYITLNEFKSLHIAVKKQVLFNMFEKMNIKKDISGKHINKIIDLIDKNNTSFDVNLVGGIVARRRYDKLYFSYKEKYNKEKKDIYFPVENNESFEFNNDKYIIKLEKRNYSDKNSDDKYIDYDKIVGSLSIRSRQSGDVFSPLGLKGSKSIKKYFIDKKIPKEKRDEILLLTDEENIIAVLGYDISDKYKANMDTKKILNIHYKNCER